MGLSLRPPAECNESKRASAAVSCPVRFRSSSLLFFYPPSPLQTWLLVYVAHASKGGALLPPRVACRRQQTERADSTVGQQ
jgi:hypothetical protein